MILAEEVAEVEFKNVHIFILCHPRFPLTNFSQFGPAVWPVVSNISIYILCLGVCLYPKNVGTAELIGPKFCVGHHVILGKVYV